MSAPDTCPQCGSPVRASIPDVGIQFECAAIALDSGHFSEALPCYMRQRDQLAAELQTLRTANAALVERMKRLEAAGDGVFNASWDVQCWKGTRLGDCLDQWEAAKGRP